MDEKKEVLKEEELEQVVGGQGDWRAEAVDFAPGNVIAEKAD